MAKEAFDDSLRKIITKRTRKAVVKTQTEREIA